MTELTVSASSAQPAVKPAAISTPWEVVNDAASVNTVNAIMDRYARQLEEPNGYPVEPFMNLFFALCRKLERRGIHVSIQQEVSHD